MKDMGLSWSEMRGYIDKLEKAVNDDNFDECKLIFKETVSGYTSDKKIY